MSVSYSESNDAYNQGAGGSGGISAILPGLGIQVDTGIPGTPVVSALVRGVYNAKAILNGGDNFIELAQLGNIIEIPDGAQVSPGPGWDTALYEGSNPVSGISLKDIREGLNATFSIDSGIPFLVVNRGTSSLNIFDTTGTFNGAAGPYILPAKSALMLVSGPAATNWTCVQIGPVRSIQAGTNISIDNTNPESPIISASGGADSFTVKTNLLDLLPGTLVQKIFSDVTDPAKSSPVVLSAVDAGGSDFLLKIASNIVAGSNISIANVGNQMQISAVSAIASGFGDQTMPEANCVNGYAIPNINNGGSVLATLKANQVQFNAKNLSCFIKQSGSGLVCLAIYNTALQLIARTATFAPSSTGYITKAIAFDGAGLPITQIQLLANTQYYFALWGSQLANGAQFYGRDNGTTLGILPYLGRYQDNVAAIPATLGGSESSIRFYVGFST